ncbi:MAG: 8-amino-7-oxononanoate synthase, partial [Halioglobus sp.]|nr:8-amino-7-oxononanoate synthase [Halioglobus sp.]
MGEFSDRLTSILAQRTERGLYRSRATLASAQGPRVEVEGKRLLNFCSNDYLGLAAHPRVIERLRTAAAQYGVGSGASHLVCGHLAPHHELEEALADFTGRSRALLFSSGYMANTGVLTTLLRRGDEVFEDRLNHASLLDGGLFSGARFRRFAHNDVDALARKLSRGAAAARLVVVDGVFSMDGDSAPLGALAQLCAGHDAWLMVDDAHGFGVLGATGAGSLEAAQLGQDSVPVLMATLGKALGTAGAFVAGSELLVEALIQQARNYIYTTAIPPAVAAATLESLALLREEAWRRDHLRELIARFRRGAAQLDLPLMPSASAIQPLLVGAADAAVALSERLAERGVLIGAIRPPTVPEGTARLRITLSAAHSERQVDTLLQHLADC